MPNSDDIINERLTQAEKRLQRLKNNPAPTVPVYSMEAPTLPTPDLGIKFNTYPQENEWLYVKTTDGAGSPNGWGIELNDTSLDGIWIHSAWNVRIEATHWLTLNGPDLVEIGSSSTVSIQAPVAFRIHVNGTNQLNWEPGGFGASAGFLLDIEGSYLHMTPDGIRMQSPAPHPIGIFSGDYMDISAGGGISIGSNGPEGAVLVAASHNPGGQVMMYNCIGVPGVYGSYPTAGHFFMLEGGTTYGGTDSFDSYFEVRDYLTTAPLLRIVRAAGGAISFHMKSGATWVADL